MSVKKDLYLAVKKRVLNTTSIQHFALYNSQFEELDKEDAFPFPCVFLEFSDLQYETVAKGGQKGDFEIRLHVGFESIMTEDLEILSIIDDLHEKLQGFTNSESSGIVIDDPKDYFLPLNRVSESQDTNHDNITVWQIDYSTFVHDNSGHVNNGLIKTKLTTLDVDLDPDTYKPRLPHLP